MRLPSPEAIAPTERARWNSRPWIAPAAALLAAIVAVWIGASNRRALADSERRANIDAQLSDKRQELYWEVLQPWVYLITPDVVWNTDPKTKGKDK